jgi:hypothetical protein
VVTAPSVCVTVAVPQTSVANALPNAALIADEVGLHPRVELLYVPLKTGGVTSDTQVIVLLTDDVLPHASVAVNVLICVRVHPLLLTAPSLCVTVGVPQASVAVAEPSAVVMAVDVGLHPKFCSVYVPVKTGGLLSFDHDTVLEVVAVLPHASVAVQVLVCVVIQPKGICGPSA